jgi:hypothetical protein
MFAQTFVPTVPEHIMGKLHGERIFCGASAYLLGKVSFPIGKKM